jgi:hypothetical protein
MSAEGAAYRCVEIYLFLRDSHAANEQLSAENELHLLYVLDALLSHSTTVQIKLLRAGLLKEFVPQLLIKHAKKQESVAILAKIIGNLAACSELIEQGSRLLKGQQADGVTALEEAALRALLYRFHKNGASRGLNAVYLWAFANIAACSEQHCAILFEEERFLENSTVF